MSPNLVAGSASNATPLGSGADTDAGLQAILQQWQEVKTEQGTVERTYTQCAQTWPLASHVKLEGIESAIHILRQACDYLHEGMMKLGSVTDQKCDTAGVHQVVAELMSTLQQLQARCTEGSQKADLATSRMEEMAGEAANTRKRLEGLERRVGIEGQQHEVEMQELRSGHEQHEADLRVLLQNTNEYQADLQARDHETFELKELIFKVCVELDEFREELKKTRGAPGREQSDVSTYQEQVGVLRQSLDGALQQLETLERKVQEGEHRFSQLQKEVQDYQREPKPEGHEGISEGIQRTIEDRLAKIEGRLNRQQQQNSRWQEDSVRDFQEVEAYLTRVHKMVLEGQQAEASSSTPKRPRLTRLASAAWKGDLRVEVEAPDTFHIGEVVILGEQEAKMVVDKGSLIFRFPIERDYPEGTVIRPLADDEFLQSEGDRLCVYRRGSDDDIHYVCRVDLMERVNPERVSEVDEAQEHAYGEGDLEARVRRILEAREAAQGQGGGISGVMIPPLSAAPEGSAPFRARAVDLPAFGQSGDGQSHREPDAGRPIGDTNGHDGTSYLRVKQEDEAYSPLDEYFCKGMDTSGPAAWATVLRDMTAGNLPDVGQLNAREGVREENWKRGKGPHPQDFSLTKKTARFTKGQFRPY